MFGSTTECRGRTISLYLGLGHNACIELGCLEILDNDALHKPETDSGNVFATQQVVTKTHLPHSDSPLSIEQLKQSYKSVFSVEK